MKKASKLICAALAAAALLAVGGCQSSAAPAETAAAGTSAEVSETSAEAPDVSSETETSSENTEKKTFTVVDHNDNVVTIKNNPERIVVCDILPLPSVLSIFFDSAENIVGMSKPSMTAAQNSLLSELYPEILNAETGFIDGTNVNVEELMKLEPDVVFYSASSKELGEQLTNAGFSAVAISVNKWDYDAIVTLNNWISLIGEIFPDNDKTQLVTDYSNEKYQMVQERVAGLTEEERARAFFLFKYDDTSIMTSGKQFFGQWWADAIGAVNVAEELTKDNSIEVNMEQVYTWNPDLLFITNFTAAQPEDLYSNAVGNYDWSAITAVQNKRVFKMPLGMYRSYTPGVDTPITLMWLAKTAYPELFEDIDITSETKAYYKEVFNIELTDEQADSIFTPTSDAAAGF